VTKREEMICARLQETFAPIACQLEDESASHAGHAGAASGGGHYRLRLVSAAFEGQNRVTRHRLVYDCLHDMMQADIHALTIIALAPSEV
jgi:BolA family transcriptional regulator, general stress-responsive regulator